jgi:hypothetical protein
MRAIRVAVTAVHLGIGGIDESDPELRVGRHLEAEAARQRVIGVDAQAVAERRCIDSFRPR